MRIVLRLDQRDRDVNYNDQLKRLGTSDGTYKVLYIGRIVATRGDEWYQDMTCVGAISKNTIPDALLKKLVASG